MYCSISFQDGKTKYKLSDEELNIGMDWLEGEMINFGWNITSYSTKNCELTLYGLCPEERIIEVKKFIYDNYPYAVAIYPRTYSMSIDFSIPVTVLI